jgi:replicative DNA helicase
MSTFKDKKDWKGKKPAPIAETANLKAEGILLGTCMLNNGVYEQAAQIAFPAHMGDAFHKQAWEAMGRIIARGKQADASSIIPEINAEAPIVGMARFAYLEGLHSQALKDPAKVISQAEAVVAAWKARETEKYWTAHQSKLSATGGLEAFLGDLMKVAGQNKPDSYGPVKNAIAPVMQAIRARRARGGGISGISTGYPKLDELLDGLRPATLTIIGARPKQGKTAVLLSIIANLCRAGVKCAFFSLEMPKDQVVQRLIAMEAGVDYSRFTRGRYDHTEEEAIENAAAEVDSWPLIIDDAGSLTPSAISMRARNAVNVDGCKVVFIDYLQRISPEKGSKRYEEVTAISMAIADLRKTLNAPIVCAAQLNRKLVDRSAKTDWSKWNAESTRPNDGDLRDSGQIEQDADALLFINRPIVTLELMKPTEGDTVDWELLCNRWRTKAEIIVHYNRAGRSGIVDFKFSGPTMRFDEVA